MTEILLAFIAGMLAVALPVLAASHAARFSSKDRKRILAEAAQEYKDFLNSIDLLTRKEPK